VMQIAGAMPAGIEVGACPSHFAGGVPTALPGTSPPNTQSFRIHSLNNGNGTPLLFDLL